MLSVEASLTLSTLSDPETIKMIIQEQKLPLINHPQTRLNLYPHQAVMLDEWEKHKTFLLETKTGTGKTIGAVMPLLKRKQRAILIYPTNELIRDQVTSITGFAAATEKPSKNDAAKPRSRCRGTTSAGGSA